MRRLAFLVLLSLLPALAVSADITGWVLDEAGRPLADVPVTAERSEQIRRTRSLDRRTAQKVAETTTGALYRIGPLVAGKGPASPASGS